MEMIRSNLARQIHGFELLHALLEEEFSHLQKRDTEKVTRVEFSIQELLRQLGSEREMLAGLVRERSGGESRLSGVLEEMDPETGRELGGMLHQIQQLEQRCSRQADVNAEIAIGLAEQGRSLLQFLHQEIQPKANGTYSARGRVNAVQSGPAMVRGRL